MSKRVSSRCVNLTLAIAGAAYKDAVTPGTCNNSGDKTTVKTIRLFNKATALERDPFMLMAKEVKRN
jgi:hypothetical protein